MDGCEALSGRFSAAKSQAAKERDAFTLIELLVVISLIGVLIAMLLPALQTTRERTRVVMCGANLRQMALAITAYAHDNSQWTPVANAYLGIYNDHQEYDFTVLGRHYVSNLTSLFPDYTNSKKLWLCPSFRGRDLNPDYNFWYSWIDKGGPLNPAAYKRSSYLYTPCRNIASPLAYIPGSGIYGQGSVRIGQSWTDGVNRLNYDRTVLMSDMVADSRLVGGNDGCVQTTFFASQHFDGRNTGGNAMHGDGSVEWVGMSTGRWLYIGAGYHNVTDQ